MANCNTVAIYFLFFLNYNQTPDLFQRKRESGAKFVLHPTYPLEAPFKGKDISGYDSFHKMYKVNHIYQISLN